MHRQKISFRSYLETVKVFDYMSVHCFILFYYDMYPWPRSSCDCTATNQPRITGEKCSPYISWVMITRVTIVRAGIAAGQNTRDTILAVLNCLLVYIGINWLVWVSRVCICVLKSLRLMCIVILHWLLINGIFFAIIFISKQVVFYFKKALYIMIIFQY